MKNTLKTILLSCILTLPLPISNALASTLEIKIDKVKIENNKYVAVGDGPFKDMFPNGLSITDSKLTQGRVIDRHFEKDTPWGSIGLGNGSIIRNSSKKNLTDLHIEVINNETFKNSSTGGNAFTQTMISEDRKTLDFKKGNFKPGEFFWMLVPKAPQPGETGVKFMGRATPEMKKKKEKPKQEKCPCTGNKGEGESPSPENQPSPQSQYDSESGQLEIFPTQINFTHHNGQFFFSNGSTETIIGSDFIVNPMTLIGLSNDIKGGFEFSDSGVVIRNETNSFLEATLTDIIAFPDHSVNGFDTVLQATLLWEESPLSSNSEFLDEFFALSSNEEPTLFFRSNLLSKTINFSESGTSDGAIAISAGTPVPEPNSTLSVLLVSMLSLTSILKREKETS